MPLVFLHGWAMTPAIWQPMAGALGGDASDIHIPALPGHGVATANPRNSLAAWVEALAPALPRDAVLVGWSLGALLALELARVRPRQVARLALIGSTPRFVASADWPHGLDEKTVSDFIEGYARDPAATLRRFLILQTLGDDARDHLFRRLSEAVCAPRDGQTPKALADGLHILAATDLRANLAAIEQPVCLIHGDGDALMPPAAVRWLADTLPRARLRMLENRGHAPLVSARDECAAAIRAHLRAELD
ncbi:MAG: alpha/beta fold hydrolase [Azoarcus sp.]|jgi:pimeloyl-[acyl-carrier protein] methyl ester esterase|nr:alpha/beta fold hydrolase [Azoarcus sp.]